MARFVIAISHSLVLTSLLITSLLLLQNTMTKAYGFGGLECMMAEQGMAAGTAESLHLNTQGGGRKGQIRKGMSVLNFKACPQ